MISEVVTIETMGNQQLIHFPPLAEMDYVANGQRESQALCGLSSCFGESFIAVLLRWVAQKV